MLRIESSLRNPRFVSVLSVSCIQHTAHTQTLYFSFTRLLFLLLLHIQLLYSIQSSPSQAIRRTTSVKGEEVYNIFHKELKMASREVNQKTSSTPDYMPRMAGQAHWARALRHRSERPMEVSTLLHSNLFLLVLVHTRYFPHIT